MVTLNVFYLYLLCHINCTDSPAAVCHCYVWIKNTFNNRISKINSMFGTLCDDQQAARICTSIISRKVLILSLKSSFMIRYIPSSLLHIAETADLWKFLHLTNNLTATYIFQELWALVHPSIMSMTQSYPMIFVPPLTAVSLITPRSVLLPPVARAHVK